MKNVCLFVCLLRASAQECGTESPPNSQLYERNAATPYVATTTKHCINVAFRVVRNNDGSNGYDVTKIPQILNELNLYFKPHNIYINQVGTFDYINNTNSNNGSNASIATVPNAINIYIVSNYDYAGQAFDGSGTTTRVFIRKSALLNIDNTLSHEIGHCLNLKHTFQCSYYPSEASPCYGFDLACAENPSISNDATRGDLVADTPADKYATSNSCVPLGWNVNLYNPNKKILCRIG